MARQARHAKGDAEAGPALGRKDYDAALARLHVELVHMQDWIKATGAKVCIVFEGRDGAGKGGTIKAITERVSPRVFRVVALPAPTERERTQMYMQRYIPHLPAAGEVVIFDRSWYNRAGVERVMGFASDEQVEIFLRAVPLMERAIVGSSVLLLKYWLEVTPEEQTRRLQSRIEDGRKTWKLTDMDLKSYSRWYDYSRARDAMFEASDTDFAPWHVVRSDNKRRARLNIISHLLDSVPYERVRSKKVTLPARQKPGGYAAPDYPPALGLPPRLLQFAAHLAAALAILGPRLERCKGAVGSLALGIAGAGVKVERHAGAIVGVGHRLAEGRAQFGGLVLVQRADDRAVEEVIEVGLRRPGHGQQRGRAQAAPSCGLFQGCLPGYFAAPGVTDTATASV